MSTAILGSGTFQDLYAPAKGKSEWGMDTLTRRVCGARSLLNAYIATLEQGDFYEGYYLQTWEPDDGPVVAIVTLNYKGLITGGTPAPLIETEVVLAVGRTSNDYSNLNDGLGLMYRRDVYATAGETVPDNFGFSSYFYRDRYTVSAGMEFTYKAPQTRYRYITVGRPTAARYDEIGFEHEFVIEDARISLSDGTVYYGTNRQTTFSLTPVEVTRVMSFTSRPVVGTPWWECEDIIRLELANEPEP